MSPRDQSVAAIGPETSIRDILTRYPSAEVVFERHGLLGCGGSQGPREPVGFFARVHHVDPEDLLRELNEHVARQPKALPMVATRPPVAVVYPIFLVTSLFIALFAGFTTGVVAITSASLDWVIPGVNWLILIQTHGRLQLYGWAGLFVFGVAYHIIPRFVTTPIAFPRLARASYWLAVAGLVLGLAQMVTNRDALLFHRIFSLGLLFLLASAAAYATVLFGTVRASGQSVSLPIKLVLAGAAWLVLGAALEVAVGALSQPGTPIDSAAEEPALEAILEGFLVLTALGVSLRTLPTFAGLRETRQRLLPGSFVASFLGVTGLVLGALLAGDLGQVALGRPIAAVGALLLLSAVVTYLWAIRLFESASLPVAEMGSGSGWLRAVRAAYGWLVVALLVQAEASIGAAMRGQPIAWGTLGAARHAMALGFVTLLIVGMASRVIPVFAGKPLWKSWLVDVAAGLLVASVAIRVPVEILAPYGSSAVADLLLTLSGPLAWFGLIAFTVNFVVTMIRVDSARTVAAAVPVAKRRGNLRSGDLLAEALRIPGGLGLLLELGFEYLADPGHRAIAARSLTIAQAARRADQDPQRVLDALNRSLGAASADTATLSLELTVAQVLERNPATLDVLIRHGFTPLANPLLRQRLASTITVADAAKRFGVDADELLRDLQLVKTPAEPANSRD